MSKLDEIEKLYEIAEASQDTIIRAHFGMEYGPLLIRAVREFWELAEARRGERAFAKLDIHNEENWRKASDRLNNAVLLDSDVLKLIEDGK